MVSFFGLGLQELIILGILIGAGALAVAAVVFFVLGVGKKKDD